MDYFFIAGNVASVAALIGFLLQVGHVLPDHDVTRVTLAISVLVTVAFWLYFYAAPTNRIKKAIRQSLEFAGSYVDSSNNPVEVFEGEFTLSDFGVLSVPIPPFETLPTITVYPVGHLTVESPSVRKVTLDSFEIGAMTSRQWSSWRYRARGRQLVARAKHHLAS
jgi:uncharacterized protein with PQ loop repeat